MAESVKWHPKLTPYRVIVLGTTIGIGTAKAIISQKGMSTVSTTLEWVSGVLIFLILHMMGTYDESPKDPPPFLRWLFQVDCMDYVWKILSYFHIVRPSYSSDLDANARSIHNPQDGLSSLTPLTLYRLIVCLATTCFGLTKATLTYFGYSTAANWIDWALGVGVTTGLYILGLYENNPVGTWHDFFSVDYADTVGNGFAALTLSFFFVTFVASSLWVAFETGTGTGKPIIGEFLPIANRANQLTELGFLQDRLLRACLVLFMIPNLLFSALCILGGIAKIVDESNIASWNSAVDWVWRHAPTLGGDIGVRLQPRSTAKRVAMHVILHLVFFAGCGVYLAFWIISIACSVEDADWLLAHRITTGTIGLMVVIIGVALVELFCAAACMFLIWIMAHGSFLPPILHYWDGHDDWYRSMIFA